MLEEMVRLARSQSGGLQPEQIVHTIRHLHLIPDLLPRILADLVESWNRIVEQVNSPSIGLS